MFLLILVVHFFYYCYLFVTARIPAGHDAFQYFSLQYYFLNHVVNYQEIPQWMPYMTMGTVASWWYGLQAGFLQNSWLLLSGLVSHCHFVHAFLLGMYVNELFLLVGCWLWAKRFLKYEISLAFFTLTIWSSSIWLTQPWFNFHSCFCLPLILHFFHRFFETSRWRYCLAAFHLLFMQMLGNLPYMLPLITWVVFLYFLLMILFQKDRYLRMVRSVKLGWSAIGVMVGVLLTGYLVYQGTMHGTEQIISYNFGRLKDGSSSLVNFLTYGGGIDLQKWTELFIGISPELNYNLYGGLSIVPFVVCVLLFRLNKRIVPIILLIIFLLDFSVGGVTAVIAYKFWPMMKYYRHISLIAPMIKLFICLMAAYAVDLFLAFKHDSKKQLVSWKVYVPAILFFCIGVLEYRLFNQDSLVEMILSMIPLYRPDICFFHENNGGIIYQRLMFLFILSILFLIGWILWAGFRNFRKQIFIGLLILHCIDIGAFKLYETQIRSFSAKNFLDALNFQKMPFAFNRDQPEDRMGNNRLALIRALPLAKSLPYWSNDSFLLNDSLGKDYRTDHWLRPLDQLLMTYQDAFDATDSEKHKLNYPQLIFPTHSINALKLAGVLEGKLQFFTDIIPVANERKASEILKDSEYSGDIPVVIDSKPSTVVQPKLSDDARENADFQVIEFDANRLDILVTAKNDGWLYYSDVWHPDWKVMVNGKSEEIFRTNLAFKIVKILKGENRVKFYLDVTFISFVRGILAVFSLVWVCVVLIMTMRLIMLSRILSWRKF